MDVRNGAMYSVQGSVELEEVETEGNTSGSKQQSFSLEVCDVQPQICTFFYFLRFKVVLFHFQFGRNGKQPRHLESVRKHFSYSYHLNRPVSDWLSNGK